MYKYDQDRYDRYRRWEKGEEERRELEWLNWRWTYKQPYVPQMTFKGAVWTIGLSVCTGVLDGCSPYLTQKLTELLWPNRHHYNDYPVMSEKRVQRLTEEDIPKRSYQVCDHPFPVDSHLRNLHEGQKPSPQKIAKAEELGIHLDEGQTWVKAFTKGESKR